MGVERDPMNIIGLVIGALAVGSLVYISLTLDEIVSELRKMNASR